MNTEIIVRVDYNMLITQVNLLHGRSTEIKRKYATELTKVTCECLNVPPGAVRIIFNDMKDEDYAVAGILVADKGK